MTITGRGIWTPDGGDNFDFTVDLGAMAESIDLALGDVEDSALEEAQEGVPRRFNTLSALQDWTPADGAIGFVIADNRHYVRLSGQWRVALEDTGWVSLGTPTGSWQLVGGSSLDARVLDGVVHFRGVLANSSFSGGFTTIATLPSAIPEPSFGISVASVGINTATANVTVRVSGRNLQMYVGAATAAWFDISALRYPVG